MLNFVKLGWEEGARIKEREVVNRDREIRSEKLRELQYINYARCLESKRVEWDEERNVKQIW